MDIISKIKKGKDSELWIRKLLPDDKEVEKHKITKPIIDIRIYFLPQDKAEYSPTKNGFRIEEKYMPAFVKKFDDFIQIEKNESNFSAFVLSKEIFLMLNDSIYKEIHMKEMRFCKPTEIPDNLEVGIWTNHWQEKSTKNWDRRQGLSIPYEVAVNLNERLQNNFKK